MCKLFTDISLKLLNSNPVFNKNPFQYNVYHLLIDRISSYPMHAPQQPRMPPQQPCKCHNHTCPPATMHTPSPQPCMPPPPGNHASTPNHACPLQPCVPLQPCMNPATTHAPHNHTCPPTTHAPHNHACPPQPCTTPPPPMDRMTHTCKNITLPQTWFVAVIMLHDISIV